MCHALIQCPQQKQQKQIQQLPCLKSRIAAELCQGAAHCLNVDTKASSFKENEV